MTDPIDPDSIPILTDVMVPGRPPIGRPGETHEDAAAAAQAQPAVAPPPAEHVHDPAAAAPRPAGAAQSAHAWDVRDVELIAERMRTRFSSYLRQEARGAIELRCRDAVAEHTNWLVRQVTRDVVTALEAEVANWVRDAVREELARHESQR